MPAQAELDSVRAALEASEADAMSEAERQAALRAQAEQLLAEQQEVSTEAQRQIALLNQQTAALRDQLGALQSLLADARGATVDALAAEAEAQAEIDQIAGRLNTALARLAEEQRARAELEARERERLEAEARDLERYRSEFFGRMSAILGEREGVQVVGDRFVFQSEVLFPPGAATLGAAGQQEVRRVASVIRGIIDEVPPEIDWILRVDGHTDRIPVSPGGAFRDNWELSQARALSVVRLMIDQEGVPPQRLAANGFGEYQPIDPGDSPDALARNRRIELKFTER